MGDLTRGETFADGETVNAERLHKLVDDATINDFVVGTDQLADGSVTSEKISGSLKVEASAVKLAEGAVLVGTTGDTGIGVPASAEFTVGTSFGIATGGLTTTMLKDGAVTGAKLESLTSPNPAGTYGSATHYPTLIVDNKGRVTAADQLPLTTGGSSRYTVFNTVALTFPGTVTYQFYHSLGDNCAFLMWLECVTKSQMHEAGDRIPLTSFFGVGSNGVVWPAFAIVPRPKDPGPPEVPAGIWVRPMNEAGGQSRLAAISLIDGLARLILPQEIAMYAIGGMVWELGTLVPPPT